MISYPIFFKQRVCAESYKPWKVEFLGKNLDPLSVDIPVEFGGVNLGYAPEDFYAASMLNCFVATLQYLVSKSDLNYEKLEIAGNLIVDRNEKGLVDMEKMEMQLVIFGASDKTRFKNLIEEVKNNCLILNSVKTELDLKYEIIC